MQLFKARFYLAPCLVAGWLAALPAAAVHSPGQASAPSRRPDVATSGSGTGLKGLYFDATNFTHWKVARIDPTVDFDWGANGSPSPSIHHSAFSVCWMGQVMPRYSETYTFWTLSDDGVRLWVNNKLVVDNWTTHTRTENSGTVTLTAGQLYHIKLKYFQSGGPASVRLSWSSTSQAKEVVPAGRLYPVTPPPAPSGLTAVGQWATRCARTNGMAMAHIVLNWTVAAGDLGYNIYRDGALLDSNVTAHTYTDMTVHPGHTYQYAVSGLTAGGEGPPCAPVSATAPNPPGGMSGMLTPPANLQVIGFWQNGSADGLAWSPVPGAVSYNVYQYDVLLIGGVTGTVCLISPTTFLAGLSYTVTAVDASGSESRPSTLATAQGAQDPGQQPGWTPDPPEAPSSLVATPEWNNGAPRIRLTWKGGRSDYTYNVYRDGTKVATGLWGLVYLDADLVAGAVHSYTVSGVNVPWTSPVESALSAPVTANALTGAPAPSASHVQITTVTADDDSAQIAFAAVPGAADYRVYAQNNPSVVKYSGGSLSIEWNGIDPATGTDLIVEAVDKPGPYQKMDGSMGPGMASMGVSINGQGDASNLPNVLATSAAFHITCQPRTLTGQQVFFDTFRNSQPLTRQPNPTPPPGVAVEFYGNPDAYRELANNLWTIRDYGGDIDQTQAFFMGNHFMDALYDGGTAHKTPVLHNNNATLVMMPRATADLSGGRVLHVTFEVDPHFDSRRWCDVLVGAAGDLLVNPGKLDGGLWPTVSGNLFRWEIQNEFHHAQEFLAGQRTELIDLTWDSGSERFGPAARIRWDGVPLFNGTTQNLDKRHRYDLYLSQTRYRLMEQGTLIKDAALPVPLPFSSVQVYWAHEVYHTGNDRPELIEWSPQETYWYNHRPWADERHWDNMGFEVLPDFPQ